MTEATPRRAASKIRSGTNLGAISGLIVGSLAGPAIQATPASLVLGALIGLIVGAAVGFGADLLDSALTPRAGG
jgi:hypothetical protein